MPNEPIQGGPYPLLSDAANVPNDIKKVVDWAAPKMNMTFNSTGERDAQVPSPTDGMECVVGGGSAAAKYIYLNGEWHLIATGNSEVTRQLRYSSASEVFDSTASGITIGGAGAVVAIGADGVGSCTLRFSVSGLSSDSGSQRVDIGVLAPDLRPAGAFAIPGYYSNGSLMAACVGGAGTIELRWSSAATSNTKFFNTSYTLSI